VKYKATNDLVIKHPALFQHKISSFGGFNPQITMCKCEIEISPVTIRAMSVKPFAGWLKGEILLIFGQ